MIIGWPKFTVHEVVELDLTDFELEAYCDCGCEYHYSFAISFLAAQNVDNFQSAHREACEWLSRQLAQDRHGEQRRPHPMTSSDWGRLP